MSDHQSDGQPTPRASGRVERWEVEDERFWSEEGRRVARRNLWISIPNLLCAFAVWQYWSIIIVQIQKLHAANPALFDFAFGAGAGGHDGNSYRALLYTLPAVAGLSGATLRIPNSFMIAISGGRNVIAWTTMLLLVPAAGVGVALQDPDVSFLVLVVLAALSGVGGGAFASSMSNISFFFPKRVQGMALGLNAGLGNLGVSVMQLLLPLAMTAGIFGALGGDPYTLQPADGGASSVWVQNAGLVWVPVLVVCAALAWWGMDNLPQHQGHPALPASGRLLWLELLGFVGAGVGIALLLADWGLGGLLGIVVIMVVVVAITLALMRWATTTTTRTSLLDQFTIFRSKHNWAMTWLYIMTFGSFIGFSAAFPKLIDDVFGVIRVDADGTLLAASRANPDGPNPFAFAWLGPLVGSLARPIGGWMSDKWGGARVTHWNTVVMIAATLGVGYFVMEARMSATPEASFLPFLLLFLVLFITTGVGNGSTFRMVPIIFPPAKAGPVLGWISAIAAYGAFLIPRIFGRQIQIGVPEAAFWGFAIYYLSCLALNWYLYARKNAEVPC